MVWGKKRSSTQSVKASMFLFQEGGTSCFKKKTTAGHIPRDNVILLLDSGSRSRSDPTWEKEGKILEAFRLPEDSDSKEFNSSGKEPWKGRKKNAQCVRGGNVLQSTRRAVPLIGGEKPSH